MTETLPPQDDLTPSTPPPTPASPVDDTAPSLVPPTPHTDDAPPAAASTPATTPDVPPDAAPHAVAPPTSPTAAPDVIAVQPEAAPDPTPEHARDTQESIMVRRTRFTGTDPDKIDLSKAHALVVEDDAGGLAIVAVMMRYLGVRAYINTTGDGVLALGQAMQPAPDVIFLDINLPRTNGYILLNQLRADPRLGNVLVIATTAQDADSEMPKARAAGFDGYIGKPLSRIRFPRQFRRILSGDSVWETY